MTVSVAAYLVAAALYAGFQWTVRGVVYPQMDAVPPDAWSEYEAAHQRRTSLVVGPLFAALVVAVLWLLVDRASDVRAWIAAGLLASLLAVTGFGAVPQHRRLSTAFHDTAYRQLLRWDSVRLMLAVAQGALAVWLVLDP